MKDLICLVADASIKATIQSLLLDRKIALDIRESLQFECYAHSDRDPGCALRAHEFLRNYTNEFSAAIVVLDYEGSGWSGDAESLRSFIVNNLLANGWTKAQAIVIQPELEAWVWSQSNQVSSILGWEELQDMKSWLGEKGFQFHENGKPFYPKEAMQTILKKTKTAKSSSLYSDLASRVSFTNCTDTSFNLLKTTLQQWFNR